MALVAQYNMNENAANTDVADASGNGNSGTSNRNTNAYDATGKVNGALHFDPGSSDYISLGSLDLLGAFYISAWVNLDVRNTTAMTVVSQYDATGDKRSWGLVVNNGVLGTVMIARSSGGADYLGYRTANVLAATATWYFVEVSYDGAGSVPLCYVDGVAKTMTLVASSGTTGNGQFDSGVDTQIGASVAWSGARKFFDGMIDVVRIRDNVPPDFIRASYYNFGKGTEECEPWQRLIQPVIQRVPQSLVGV